MMVAVSPNQEISAILCGIFYTVWNLFSGHPSIGKCRFILTLIWRVCACVFGLEKEVFAAIFVTIYIACMLSLSSCNER